MAGDHPPTEPLHAGNERPLPNIDEDPLPPSTKYAPPVDTDENSTPPPPPPAPRPANADEGSPSPKPDMHPPCVPCRPDPTTLQPKPPSRYDKVLPSRGPRLLATDHPPASSTILGDNCDALEDDKPLPHRLRDAGACCIGRVAGSNWAREASSWDFLAHSRSGTDNTEYPNASSLRRALVLVWIPSVC
ncbi:hypothetical protein TIFTF001_018622 [Ficus carica]|uniref:Uncharacterized protein n=1 Tax=Ficus carica TaxID=3494 RepID=A0AA88DAX7_FICCA|nr:hypothetical protein TIFTF001_018622 [Ficus carica]